MPSFVALLIGPRHPEGEQPQNPAGPLKPRQHLPLPFEGGQDHRMKGIGGGEDIPRLIDGEEAGDLVSVFDDPVGIFADGLFAIIGQAAPLEEPAADDLRRFRFSRHDDGFAQPVEQLFEASVVPLVFRVHLSFRRRDGNGQDGFVIGTYGFGKVLEKIVELSRQAAFPVAADIIHQLIEQDEARSPLGKESPDNVTGGRNQFIIVLSNNGKPLHTAQLKSDLSPWRLPERCSIMAAPSGDGIKLRPDKARRRRFGHLLDVRLGKQACDAHPISCFVSMCRQVVEQGEGMGLSPAELCRHVEYGRRFRLDPR